MNQLIKTNHNEKETHVFLFPKSGSDFWGEKINDKMQSETLAKKTVRITNGIDQYLK